MPRFGAFPADHHTRHQDTGVDEINLAGLSGEPAELTTHKGNASAHHNPACPLMKQGVTTGAEIPGWYFAQIMAFTIGGDNIFYIPIWIDVDSTFTRIYIYVTTAGTGVARLGIYNEADGKPSSLVLDAGTVDVSTTGSKYIDISQSLTGGKYYYLAVVAEENLECYGVDQAYAITLPVTGLGDVNTAADGIIYSEYDATAATGGLPQTASPAATEYNARYAVVRLTRSL